MTAQIRMRLTLLSFKLKNRKVSIILNKPTSYYTNRYVNESDPKTSPNVKTHRLAYLNLSLEVDKAEAGRRLTGVLSEFICFYCNKYSFKRNSTSDHEFFFLLRVQALYIRLVEFFFWIMRDGSHLIHSLASFNCYT